MFCSKIAKTVNVFPLEIFAYTVGDIVTSLMYSQHWISVNIVDIVTSLMYSQHWISVNIVDIVTSLIYRYEAPSSGDI